MAFLFGPAAISISFPSQKTKTFHPGDVVSGTVHLRVDVDSKGKPLMDRVDVKLGVNMQTSVAIRRGMPQNRATGTGQISLESEDEGLSLGGGGGGSPSSLSSADAKSNVTRVAGQQQNVDIFRETTELYSSEQTIWSSSSQSSSFSSLANGTSTSVHVPFGFVLPPSFDKFPPSFEGGTRSPFVVGNMPDTSDPWAAGAGSGITKGHDVARVEYYIAITGHKSGWLAINEKTRLPFKFSPPPRINTSLIPTSLPEPITPSPSHLPPPPPSDWTTYTSTTTSIRDGWTPWSPKGSLTVRFSLPPLPHGLPLSHPIPYHLHLSSSPSAPHLPSYLSSITLTLNRTVFSLARGIGQFIPQRSALPVLTIDLRSGERGQRGRREVVVGGLLTLPASDENGVSFAPEGGTRGMLGCEYHLALHVPIPRLGNDLKEERFVWPMGVGEGFDPREREGQEAKRALEVKAWERRMRGHGAGDGEKVGFGDEEWEGEGGMGEVW